MNAGGRVVLVQTSKAAGAFAQFPSLEGDSDPRSRQIQLTITYAETLISLSRRLQWKPSLQPRGNSGIRYNRLFGESTTSSILTAESQQWTLTFVYPAGPCSRCLRFLETKVGLSNCPRTAVPQFPVATNLLSRPASVFESSASAQRFSDKSN